MVGRQRDKAQDAKTKSELNRLRIAFEDYYGDHNCYPPPEWFDSTDDCGSENLRPYLGNIPCDPTTNLPYIVEYDNTGCKSYKLYGNLKYVEDPDRLALCSTGGSTAGNYGVSSSNTTVSIDCEAVTTHSPTPVGSPPPSTIPGTHACGTDSGGHGYCGLYPNPSLAGCPWTTTNSTLCESYCPTSALSWRCTN